MRHSTSCIFCHLPDGDLYLSGALPKGMRHQERRKAGNEVEQRIGAQEIRRSDRAAKEPKEPKEPR
jgi:hypothetical protein